MLRITGGPRRAVVAAAAVLAVAGAACGGGTTRVNSSNAAAGGKCDPGDNPVVTLAAYSNVYDVYGKLTSTFAADYKERTGKNLIFSASYGGSTTQAQNVVNGFQADVVALSLDPDVQLIEDAGLITHDWQNAPDASKVATSTVVFDVRPGNPKHIENWDDLTQDGLQILTPDPAQSGGAKWNIVAAYGAAMRGEVPGYEKGNAADAQRLLEGIFRNVTVLDKSANDSLKNFDSGNGDVAITYEYAAMQAISAGGDDEIVYPPSSIAIETPTVVVDANAAAHCVEDIANDFVEFLHTPDAQAVFHDVGFERPVDVAEAQKGDGEELPALDDLFTADDIGGWGELEKTTVFGPEGAFTRAFEAAKG